MSDYKQKYKYYKYKYLQLAGAEAEAKVKAEAEDVVPKIPIYIFTSHSDIGNIQIDVNNDDTVGTVIQHLSKKYGYNKEYIVLNLIEDSVDENTPIVNLNEDTLISALPILASSDIRTLYATFLPAKSETDILLELKKLTNYPLNWHKDAALNDWEGVTLDDTGRLVGLQLAGLYFQVLPESIGELYYLSTLILSNNSLATLPESIFNLSNLKYLDCSNNKLKRLPDSIGNLKNLEVLKLDNCFSAQRHSNPNRLNLPILTSPNVLPETIGKLTKLKTLSIGSNNLYRLPDSIGDLYNLEVLYLDSNHLDILPDSICNLRNLHTLSIEHNSLRALPSNFGHLTSLTTLFLNNNRLTTLPVSFTVNRNGMLELPDLETITYDNNPWSSSTRIILESYGGVREIRNPTTNQNQTNTVVNETNTVDNETNTVDNETNTVDNETNTGEELAPSMFGDDDY